MSQDPPSSSSFHVDVYGQFERGQVKMNCRQELARRSAAVDQLVAQVWAEQTEAARQRGCHLFNGSLARLLRYRVNGPVLELDVGPTDYATFMGTNLLNTHRRDELGADTFSDPMGTSANIITADGWLVLGRRSDQVAWHRGYAHTIGGGIEAHDALDDGTIDVFASMERELREEIGIAPGDISDFVCLGMIRDLQIGQPELIFDVTVRRDCREFAAALDHEHSEIITCRDDPAAIPAFLRDTPLLAPIAQAAMLLHGRRRFGESWYERTLAEL